MRGNLTVKIYEKETSFFLKIQDLFDISDYYEFRVAKK